MLTDQDIEKLTSVFASKQDFKELKEEIDVIKENVPSILVSVDGIGKSFDKLDSEYVALKSQVDRHEEKLAGAAA